LKGGGRPLAALVIWFGAGLPVLVHAGGVQTLEEVEVVDSADLVGAANTATEGTVSQRQIESRPIQRAGDLLESVPGVVVTQHSGAGKANQYFLRGFNLDHGTDIAVTVDGIPVNFPTHGHGQGWIEVNFVIPELVRGIQYKKGPYYADEGDFSAAGAINMSYATTLEKGIAEVGYGSFGYRRTMLADSPKLGSGNLLYALEYYHSDGPWVMPDDYKKYNGVLRYALRTGRNEWNLTAMGYTGQWDSTDQIPQRAIGTGPGQISRFGNLDPTDGGESRRYSLSTEFQRKTGSTVTKANAYALQYRLDLFSNFTYFLDDPVNGDQFEQLDDRITAGVRASHLWFGKLLGRDMDNTIGLQVRHDNIDTIGLYKTAARQRLSTTREDSVKQTSVAVYAQNGTRWTEKFRTVAGLRGDLYLFNVDNQAPVGIEQFNEGSASDSIVSPKLAMIFGPWAKTEYYLNGGFGFHSNDGRGSTISVDPSAFETNPVACQAVTAPTDPACRLQKVDALVKAKGAEVGVRTAIV
ncbi:MAG: TonB-dependent receptor, partial [Nitrospiria bacterium]